MSRIRLARQAGLFLSCVVFFTATGRAAVDVDVSGLPEDRRFVADLFRTRVAERTPPFSRDGSLSVKFSIDPSLAGENAVIVVRDGRAEISAGRFRGLVFGAGWLLKWIDYGKHGISVRDVIHRFAPAKSLRCAYFARHLFNWYMEAPESELVRYIEDLALDGINAFLYQFSIAEVDAAHEDAAHIADFERLSKLMCRKIEALDCDFCEWGGSNQLRQDAPECLRGEPNDRKRGNLGFNACPFKPGALEAMHRLRRENLDKLEGCRVGYLCHWSFDEGGCACSRCMPWGEKGMLKTIESLHELNRKAHPEAKTIVSTWYFYDADFDGLWKYLKTHDWIDWVLCDDYGLKFPDYPLKHPIPGKTRIATFPDISMWGRFPWGGYGAIALPRFLRDRFLQSAAVADGFVYYSEGCFEDINKAVEVELYVNPKAETDDILRRYAKYHFAGADSEDFVRLGNLLEANHNVDGLDDSQTLVAVRLAEKIDREMIPSLRTSWRWRLVWLRTKIDRGIFETKSRSDRAVHPFYDEVVRIYHAERQLQWVLDGGRGGWTCPAYEPENACHHVLPAPKGDATVLLDGLLNDRMRMTYRLGSGTWKTGPIKIRPRCDVNTRIKVILEDGCRLVGDEKAFGDAKGKALFDLSACDCKFEVIRREKSETVLPEGVSLD